MRVVLTIMQFPCMRVLKDIHFSFRVDPDEKIYNQPFFIVCYGVLASLFSLFCFRCKKEKPVVRMKRNGTMVTVIQDCFTCGSEAFIWRS